ncbi:cytokine receptor-like factor 2 isoform X2 [Hyperolius riggenbachi]|uniref:cytokine receptor-like factor 2 isoform X2 n=1 Tax=Hyperolius riggenbachi TaxID=752182 RepID=UPI0035A27239
MMPIMIFLLFYLADTHKFTGVPQGLKVTWEANSMIIQSVGVQFLQNFNDKCFQMVTRVRTWRATEWQKTHTSHNCSKSDEKITCFFSNPNLDAEKCFEMQAKLQVQEICMISSPESNWSSTIFLKNTRLLEMCPEDKMNKWHQTRRVIISFSTVLSVMFISVILLGCVMKRVKKFVFPVIPDAKKGFYDLHDNQSGFIQEWMKVSRNNLQLEEVESVLEEQDSDQKSTYMKDNEPQIPEDQHSIVKPVDDATTTPLSLVEDVCFGNMNFTMNDSMYVML